ncbi:UBP-type zinc finger domain-containing protein [Streptomyces tropicalis]|uniref:UBP-type zinc finger domain-containing protein n=1 Tax=Streptomyces tropicalis TaxID=3034234 RepID=A0ABT6A3F6_9ACTN|nr:UBP-type zinc finger domain-containing protein [Streptomyces tropicalis]MDF3299186.1 UBP-type zinc finger domain-containing protein [Streptomyces tropicalis]
MAVWTVRVDGGRPEGRACAHLDGPAARRPRAPRCAQCRARGRTPVHLRQCLTCGHVGCCDSSGGAHATAHFAATGHPVARSVEPGEAWAWCYVDEVFLDRARRPGARTA